MGHVVLGEDDDDHGAAHGVLGAPSRRAQGRGQTRDAEGEAGRRRALTGEAGDQIVIAAAAADRAEADGTTLVVNRVEQQLGLTGEGGQLRS